VLKNPCDAPLLTQIEHQNTDFGGFWLDLGSSIGPTATFSKKSGTFSEVRSCRTSSATRSPRRRLQKRLPAGETRALYRRKPSSRGSVLKTAQRVEKLLRAIFCAPFRGLKPRLCSVLGSVSRCLASVFTTDHSENDFFNSLERFRYTLESIKNLRVYPWADVPELVPKSKSQNLANFLGFDTLVTCYRTEETTLESKDRCCSSG
jgi:hypothetical protein